ncbi:MAG: aldo/keto reductase, partial [bacterium]
VSNFPQEWLQELLETAEIKPQMVQVEAHPYYPQDELMALLKEYGMGMMVWYPLGHGDKSLINEPVFTKLAQKYGKSNAQIILRWHTQLNHIVIPGSKNPEHIRENFDIFDFTLTDEEMAEIKTVNKNIRYYNATIEEAQKYANMALDFEAQE